MSTTKFPTDETTDTGERKCVLIEIPDVPGHRRAFLGALYNLTRWYSWEQDAAHTAKTAADVWKPIFNKLLDCFEEKNMCCCDQPIAPQILTRINPDTLQFEQSSDGGATWQPDPTKAIPKDIPLQPPPQSTNPSKMRCDAASDGLANFMAIVDQISALLESAQTVGEIAVAIMIQVLIAILAALTSPAVALAAEPYVVVIEGILKALIDAGRANFDNYWTQSVKDKLLCAFYCSLSDDGSMSENGYRKFLHKYTSTLPTHSAAIMLFTIMRLIGRTGVNNLCSYGTSANADCSACGCGCKARFDFDLGNYNFEVDVTHGKWILGKGYVTSDQTPLGESRYFATVTIPVGCSPCYARFFMHREDATFTHQGFGYKYRDETTKVETVVPITNNLNCGAVIECGGGVYQIGTIGANWTILEVYFQIDSGTPGTSWLKTFEYNTSNSFPVVE